MPLKMKPEHRKHIADAIVEFDTDINRSWAVARGHADERYWWDLLFDAGLWPWVCSDLYPYLNDANIESALKSLVKPLVKPLVRAGLAA